jgi:hypothetical protein
VIQTASPSNTQSRILATLLPPTWARLKCPYLLPSFGDPGFGAASGCAAFELVFAAHAMRRVGARRCRAHTWMCFHSTRPGRRFPPLRLPNQDRECAVESLGEQNSRETDASMFLPGARHGADHAAGTDGDPESEGECSALAWRW